MGGLFNVSRLLDIFGSFDGIGGRHSQMRDLLFLDTAGKNEIAVV